MYLYINMYKYINIIYIYMYVYVYIYTYVSIYIRGGSIRRQTRPEPMYTLIVMCMNLCT
jgi:hypothetical protein